MYIYIRYQIYLWTQWFFWVSQRFQAMNPALFTCPWPVSVEYTARLAPGAWCWFEGWRTNRSKNGGFTSNDGEIQKQLGLVWEKWQEIMGFPANSLGFPVEVSLYHLYPILGMICPILSHPFWLTLRHFWICLNHVESKSHHLSIYVDDLGCASRNDSWLRNWNKHE